MSSALWVPGLHHRDLRHRPGGAGYDVPGWHPKGVVLHVNDSPMHSRGTSVEWYADGGGKDQVCPNWQVYPDGDGWQLLPANTQPWCQRAGNQWGVAIETGGNHAEPLTAAALKTCAEIVRFMHEQWGVPLVITDDPAHRGLGTHKMGGVPWGAHNCPGDVRQHQRGAILHLAGGGAPTPHPTPAPHPHPVPGVHLLPWPFPDSDRLGPRSDPSAHIHGGIDAHERAVIRPVQLWLIGHGHVKGVQAGTKAADRWADGVWEEPTSDACESFYRRQYGQHKRTMGHGAYHLIRTGHPR